MNENLLTELEKISAIYLPQQIIINLFLSFILGLVISLVYKKTHKGLSYSQSFMVTNIFIAVIVCMVIMIIGNSLARAFALVGALSIIRFRTVVKDTKDTAYIFWSLAVGMAAGTIIISIIAFTLNLTNFGSFIKSEFILQFRIKSNDAKVSKKYNEIISKYAKISTLLSSESSGDGKSIKLNFDLILKEDKDQTELLSKLSNIDGLSEVMIIAAKSDVDY